MFKNVTLKVKGMNSMSQLITIQGKTRTGHGKGDCRKIRKAGSLPANLIGKAESKSIEIDPKFLSVAWQNGKRFILDFDGKQREVTIKELQISPMKRQPLHVDLMYV